MLLVFGSINADMLFKVETLPRPGETVLCPGYELAAGGKGANQAAAAAKAGAEVRMVGHIGADSFGAFARDELVRAGVNCDGLGTSSRATAIAVIGVDRAAENQIIVASGANLDTHPDQVASDQFGPGVTVLCQNEIDTASSFEFLKRAKAGGARTMLNLAPAAHLEPGMAEPLDTLVVNEIEAAMALGVESIGDDALAFAADLSRKLDLTAVITLGAAGAVAAGPEGQFKVTSLAIEPVDTTGAGDAFVGGLAAALDQGETLAEALRRASVGAGLACLGLGAQTSQPTAADIEARLAEVEVQTIS
ncbi:MAG: PfkB family carbohydrate kinase [Alphaproteobacteria bacterium]